MTALDYGKWRCDQGTWHGLDEACTCPPSNLYLDLATTVAFPEHDRMATARAEEGVQEAAESFRLRIATEDALRAQYGEDFEHEVRRVMWEDRCDEPTAVRMAAAARRLGAYRVRAAA